MTTAINIINNIAITSVSTLIIDFMTKEDTYNNMDGATYVIRYLVNTRLYNSFFLALASIIYLMLSWLSVCMSKCTKFLGFPLRAVCSEYYGRASH